MTVGRLLRLRGLAILDDLLHEAEVRRLLDTERIEDVLARHRGHRGAARLRRALARRDPGRGRTRSELERKGRRFPHAARVPALRARRAVRAPGRDGGSSATATGPPRDWWSNGTAAAGVHETVRAFENGRRDDGLLLAHHGIVTVRATWRRLEREEAELADTLWRVLGR